MNVEIRKERSYATGKRLWRIWKDGKPSVAFASLANARKKAQEIRAREVTA